MSDHAQQVVGVGAFGIPVEDLPVSELGIVEAPRLMMGDGIPEYGAIIIEGATASSWLA
jgi:hypothetical protein